MKLKSFIAGPVQAAPGMAREELGTEAILVNPRTSPPEATRLGEHEAVAASVPGDATPAAPAPAGTRARRKARGPGARCGSRSNSGEAGETACATRRIGHLAHRGPGRLACHDFRHGPPGTLLALEQALREHQHKDLILIDMPGFSPGDMDAAADLAACFARRPEIDTHRVLQAMAKSADLTSVEVRFEIFRPSKLLFTRVDETQYCSLKESGTGGRPLGPACHSDMPKTTGRAQRAPPCPTSITADMNEQYWDETSSFGPAFSEMVRAAKPISFLTAGQQAPEDFEETAKTRAVELVLQPNSDYGAFAAGNDCGR